MQLHHSKHHNAYVTNYNLAVEKLDEALAANDTNAVIGTVLSFQKKNPLPPHPNILFFFSIATQAAIRFNLGGHINHSIFWENLAAPKNGGGGEPGVREG